MQAAERRSEHLGSATSSGTPIVLWAEDPRRGRLVAACCHAASKLGVRASMKLAEATELVRVPGISKAGQSDASKRRPLIQPHDRVLDQQTLEQIAVSVQQQITPKVALEGLGEKPWSGHPRHQCESLLCEISGVSHLFGDELGLLMAVEKMLAGRHLRARMAIADSVAAAWALSHEANMKPLTLPKKKDSHKDTADSSKAKQNRSSPRIFHGGLIVRGAEDTARAIGYLPVQSLRIAAGTVSTLARLGVASVSQLLSLPRSGLATRLGRDLVQRLEQVQAEVDEPLIVHQAEAEYAVTLTLQYPTADLEILTDRIKRLASQLTSRLMLQQCGALRLSCCLNLGGRKKMNLDVGLFAPTVDADHLSGLIINQLESKRIEDKVERLSLMVTLSGALRSSQSSLFELDETQVSATGMTGAAISRLVDSLSGRIGRDRVGYLELQNDPLPERAFDVLPLAGNAISPTQKRRKKRRGQSTGRWSQDVQAAINHAMVKPAAGDALRRPLALLAEPAPIRVAWDGTDFSLRVSDPHLPHRIRFNGADHLVLKHWGPERIESGWWRGKSIRRDYYRIETDQGAWWWIFRNLVTRDELQRSRTPYCWMLHGRFS